MAVVQQQTVPLADTDAWGLLLVLILHLLMDRGEGGMGIQW